MLGYRGRSNRRDFIGGCALLVVSSMAVGGVLEPLAGWMSRVLEGPAVVAASLALLAIAVAFLGVWLWGATALLTRRSRDIGWPAWVGVVAATAATGVSYLFGGPFFFVLIAVMAGMPARRDLTRAEERASVFS